MQSNPHIVDPKLEGASSNYHTANGARLRVRAEGNRNSIPVICVHEIGGSLESWSQVSEDLSNDHYVVTYDQRGCGFSEKFPDFDIHDLIADLAAVAEKFFGEEAFYLVGVALGAAVAIGYTLENPQRVKGLVLGSPTMRVSPAVLKQLEDRAETIKSEGMIAVTDASLEKSYPPSVRKDVQHFEQYRKRWLANDPHSFCAMSMVPSQLTQVGDPGDMRCSTLLLRGLHDPIRSAESLQQLTQEIPGSRFEEIEGGHFLNVQNPAALSARVRQFICHQEKDA